MAPLHNGARPLHGARCWADNHLVLCHHMADASKTPCTLEEQHPKVVWTIFAERGELQMRLIAFVVAALVLSGPASAEWKEFNSVSEGFGVVFPAEPDVQEIAMFEVVPGKMVPAH